jgi:hypothetical protein
MESTKASKQSIPAHGEGSEVLFHAGSSGFSALTCSSSAASSTAVAEEKGMGRSGNGSFLLPALFDDSVNEYAAGWEAWTALRTNCTLTAMTMMQQQQQQQQYGDWC